MQISQVMTSDVELASPDDTIRDVARRMQEHDIGFLPVGENDELVGMITDRDIVTRGVASGLDGDSKVRDVMTTDVKYCFETDEVDDVAVNMGDIQVRRLAVVDDDKRLCGIVSLADTVHADKLSTGTGFSGVVRPGGSHTQARA
ncbi:CBS domain-containing protein [Rhizobium sp. L1K21]|uniref:CBS domain-containing protein n=1 Tax=Rhizobium sp. L1K21 TaxID=2954933 RepID=UPI0020938EC9|nr:CBS domain-containing protein [Rhizobium sp. L1K21]MCO6187808.1 CBS domain-containing protein [Rhizobium sp. L1K21]